MRKIRVLSLIGLLGICVFYPARADENEAFSGKSVTLVSEDLSESSGLAFSDRDPSCVWSHNDSGDEARLFAFDAVSGAMTGRWHLQGIEAIDWEDMAIVRASSESNARIIVADCGDNQKRREFIELHVFDEPDPRASGEIELGLVRTIRVVYPDGARDCEAVAYDPINEQLILIAKHVLPWAGVYGVKIAGANETPVTATKLGAVPIAMVTAADVDSSSGDLWVATYWHAMCLKRHDATGQTVLSWPERLRQTPVSFSMPRLKQIEALALDRDAHVYVTSEGAPAPMVQIATQP